LLEVETESPIQVSPGLTSEIIVLAASMARPVTNAACVEEEGKFGEKWDAVEGPMLDIDAREDMTG
jgi:hypothetical protein